MHLLLIAPPGLRRDELLAVLQAGGEIVLEDASSLADAQDILAQGTLDILLWLIDAPNSGWSIEVHTLQQRYPTLAIIAAGDHAIPPDLPNSIPWLSLPDLADDTTLRTYLKTAYHTFHQRFLTEGNSERFAWFAQIPLPLLLLDANGYILRVNALASALLHAPEGTLRGQHLTRCLGLYAPDTTSAIEVSRTWLKIAREGNRVEQRAYYCDNEKTGNEVGFLLFLYAAQPYQNFFLLIIRDVIGELRYQQQLEVLSQLAQRAFQDLDLPVLLQEAVTEIQQRFNYDNVGIFMQYGDQLRLEALAGLKMPGVTIGLTMPVSKGVIGWTVRNREVALVPDVNRDPRFYRPAPTNAQSAMAIPIVVDDGPLGGLYLESHHLDAFGPSDVSTLRTFCRLLGLIIHRHSTDAALTYRESVQRTLLELAPVLLTEFDLNALLQRIIEEAVRLITTAQSGALLLLEGDVFAFRGVVGYPSELKQVYLPGDHYFVPNLQRGEILHLSQLAQQDAQRLPPETAEVLKKYGYTEDIVETLAAPFVLNGLLLGYLTVDTYIPGTAFNQADENALNLFASLAAIAIYNGRLFQGERRARALAEELRQISTTLSATLNLEQVLDHLLEAITGLIACDAVDILLVEDEQVYVAHGRERFGTPRALHNQSFLLSETRNLHEAAAQRAPLLIADTQTFDGWVGIPEAAWIRAQLTVPIFLEQKLVGFLCALNSTPGSLTLEDAELLAVLAPMAAMALHNARLYQAERAARDLAETLQTIGATLTQTLDEVTIIQRVAEQIPQLVPFHTLLISLVREEDRIVAVYAKGLTPEVEARFRAGVAMQTFPLWQALAESGESLLLPHAPSDPRWVALDDNDDISALVVPLRTRGHIIGFLDLTTAQTNFYRQHHLQALQSLADLLVVALSNAYLYQETQQRVNDLAAIHRLGVETGAQQLPADITQVTVDYALELTEADGAAFFEYDPLIQSLIQRQSSGNLTPFVGYQLPPGTGVSGKAWQTQKPVWVRDYTTLEARIETPLTATLHSALALPVTWQTERLGALSVFRQSAKMAFSQNDLRIMQLLAQQLAATLYRANLFQALRRDRDRLAALAAIDQQIIALSETPAQALLLILDYAVELLELPKGFIMLLDDDQHYTFHSRGLLNPSEVEQLLPANWAQERTLYHQHSHLAFTTLPPAPDALRDWAASENVQAGLNLPLKIRGEVVGVLVLLDSQPHPWGQEELDLGQTLARQASIALEKALLSRELRLRLEEAEVLNRVLQATNTTLDPQEMLRITSQELAQILQVPRVTAALLLDHSEGSATLAAPKPPTWIFTPPDQASRTPLLQAILHLRRTLVFSDLPAEQPALAAELAAPIRGALLTPLMLRGEVLGVLIAESPEPRTFTPREIMLSESIAAAITPALENAHLYQETQAAHRRTEEAYDHLRRLDALKSQFIQNVSHELRTPLAIVKGYVDLALDESFGFTMDAPLQQAMSAIQTHTNNLVQLVESITTLEDAEIENFDLQPQPILPVLLTALQSIRQAALRKQVQVSVDTPPQLAWVLVDPPRLGHAVGHLLDNAVKFNRTGGKVFLRAWVQDNEVNCQVADTGVGIPQAELERIFDRFYQVDGSSSRQYGGMGLGLSIVREVIARHGGRVWAESAGHNHGSTLTFVLPVYHPPEDV